MKILEIRENLLLDIAILGKLCKKKNLVEKQDRLKDEKKLLEVMTVVMEDSQLYHYLQSNARKMILNRFEQNVVWKALLNEYNCLT